MNQQEAFSENSRHANGSYFEISMLLFQLPCVKWLVTMLPNRFKLTTTVKSIALILEALEILLCV